MATGAAKKPRYNGIMQNSSTVDPATIELS